MPGLNGTGPMGMGPMTGRGAGRCGGGTNAGVGAGRGIGRGLGRGMGRGMGFGRGRGYNTAFSGQEAPQGYVDVNDNDVLIQRLERLEAEADKIRKQLDEINK